jgi:hypothetical protein
MIFSEAISNNTPKQHTYNTPQYGMEPKGGFAYAIIIRK